jgi:hypothetical protein
MKKSLFATIAFTVASMPLMFAAQAPATNSVAAKPAAKTSTSKSTKTPKTKGTKKSASTKSAAATPASTPVKK